MDRDPALLRSHNRGGVHRPRVAVKDDVGDGMCGAERLKCVAPLGEGRAKRDITGTVKPKRAVAGVKAHAPHLASCAP